MAKQWGKVARWTGIGNNKEDGNSRRSEEGMAEETMGQGAEENELALEGADGPEADGPETTDAGGEAGSAPSAALAEALKTELEQVRGDRYQLLDRLARLRAEFEN